MRIDFLTSLGIPDDEKKDANWLKLLYDAPIRSENVVRIGPVLANFNCLRACVLFFTPVAAQFSSELFPVWIPAPHCSSAAKWHKSGVGGAAENASTLRHHTFGSYISLSGLSPITLHRSFFVNARTNETNNT